MVIIIWLMILNNMVYQWLLVGGIPTPLKNDGVKVSWDDEIPNCFWKVIQNSMVPNHQWKHGGKKREKNIWIPWRWFLPENFGSCHDSMPFFRLSMFSLRIVWEFFVTFLGVLWGKMGLFGFKLGRGVCLLIRHPITGSGGLVWNIWTRKPWFC